jgi:hypothetical protein
MSPDDRSRLTRFVLSYRRRLIAGSIVRSWLIALFLICLLLGLLEALFSFFPWIALPAIFDIACLGTALFAVGFAVFAAAVRVPRLVATAGMIERRSELKNPLLALAIELSQDDRTSGSPFTDRTCALAARELADYPAGPLRSRSAVPLALGTIVLGVWCIANPFFSPRLLDYWSLPLAGVSRGAFVVSPGSTTVPLNAAVSLRLASSARFPSCRLTVTETGGGHASSVFLRPDAVGAFAWRIDGAKRTFSYRFELAGFGTPRADTVTVVPPPRLAGLAVALTPPPYTHQGFRRLPEGQGDFEAYAGTRAHLAVKSGSRLAGARLILGGDTLSLDIKGTTASGEFEVRRTGNYTFTLLDSLGQRSDSLPSFHIECTPDLAPSVQILRPGCSRDLTTAQVETLVIEGVDDIGIRSMALKWRLGGQRGSETGFKTLAAGDDAPIIRSSLVWRLTELSLYPGDTIRYWAEVTDTRPGGGQTGRSDTFTFRIPTFEEMHRSLAEGEDRTEKTLGGVVSQQKSLTEKMAGVQRSGGGRKELTWEQRQTLQEVKQEAAGQADSLRQSLAALRENVEKMKQQGTSGSELAEKFDRVRKAVEELIKQYGDSLLFNMKDFDKPISSQDLRQAVAKAQAVLPRLGEQLDNALKFLTMLKEDRKLGELAMRAEALAKEQKTLSRSDSFGAPEMTQQKDLLGRVGKLSEEASDQAKERSDAHGRDSLPSTAALDSLGREMQSSMDRRRQPSPESMNRMSGSLLSLSDDLLRMMNFGARKRLDREKSRLLGLAQKEMSLADWQQELSLDPRTGRDPVAAALAQQALQDALKRSRGAADSLQMAPPEGMLAISKGFDAAGRSMQQALDAMSSGSGTREATRGPVTALRSLANTLLATVSQMDNGEQADGGGGGGMMPGLRKLSGRQAAINAATSDLLRSMLGGSSGTPREGSGSPAGEQARRAAQSAQQAIADDLKRLGEHYGSQAGEGMAGKTQELEKEAERLASMLEHPTADLVEHQDRFLARMLETTLSMHRQGEGHDEFKSQSAATPFQEGNVVSSGTLFRERDAFSRLRQRAFLGNYPEDYREALRKYFDALGEKYLK